MKKYLMGGGSKTRLDKNNGVLAHFENFKNSEDTYVSLA